MNNILDITTEIRQVENCNWAKRECKAQGVSFGRRLRGPGEGAGQDSVLQSGLEMSATVLASSFLLRLLSPRVVGRLTE